MKLTKLLAGIGATILTAALAVAASAADPVVVWDFSQSDNTAIYNEDGTTAFDVNGATAAYDETDGSLKVDVTSGDPFFILPNQGTFAAENCYVRVKYYLSGISDWSTSIYFTTDTVQWSEDGHYKGIYDGDDDEWCEQTFIMTECAAWAGTITDMRLDIFDSAYEGQLAKVAYVAVFASEEDANNFDFAAWQAGGRPAALAGAAAPAETTEAAAETAAAEGALQNLCLGATVEVSGVENDTMTGDLAVDGDLTTRWASDYVDNATITVDLGSPIPVGYLELHWETASAADYVVETSSDGTSWSNVATVTGNTAGSSPASDACVVVHEWTPATARFIRITTSKRNTEYGNSLWEIVARKSADTVVSALPAGYPGSGAEVPADSVLINGERIGLEEGWGGNAAAGRDAAFDGDVNTFFDPLGTGDGWCGIDAGEEMILTKIIIHPRDAQLPRFNGATIEGANEEDFSDAVTLYLSVEEAGEFAYIDVSDEIEEADNTGYRYFRYINYTTHGDVAEVELYGKAVDGSNPTYGAAEAVVEETAAEEAPVEEAAAEETTEEAAEEVVTEEAVVEEEVEEEVVEEAAETFDFGVIAAVAAIVSAAGYALSKKR